jgi:hypothetical protein
MTKEELLKRYLTDPSTMPANVREGIRKNTNRVFFETVERFPPGMVEFCNHARERALERFFADLEAVIDSDINPTDMTFDDFMEIASAHYSKITDFPPDHVRNAVGAIEAAVDKIMEYNAAKYGMPDLSGNDYGNIASPRFFVNNQTFISTLGDSFIEWQLLVAPMLSRWHWLDPGSTYAAASLLMVDFFNSIKVGTMIGQALVSQAHMDGEDHLSYMMFFSGDNNSLSDGCNIDMPQRIERLIEMVKELWQNAAAAGFDIPDNDAIEALDYLQRILDLFLEAEPHSLHVQIVARSQDGKPGGHYSVSEKELVLYGPFEGQNFHRNKYIPDGTDIGTNITEILHHELSHALEYLEVPGLFVKGSTNYTLNMASIAFLYSRIQKNSELELMTEYPGLCMGFRDAFMFTYTGRVYSEPALMYDPAAEITDVSGISSTEALATIIGNMQSPLAMFSAFMTDRDHFSHALAVFYGTYLA